MPRIPLDVVLSSAAQIIEDTVSTSTQSQSNEGLTEYRFLRAECSCKDRQSMIRSKDWHRQAPRTYPGSQVGEDYNVFLDGSNIADPSGHELQNPIKAAMRND